MDSNEKIAHYRLSVLELAEKLGNVSQACRERGMTRTQFYQYKRRYEKFGLEGLKNLPPIHKSHPQSTPPEVVKKIISTSLKHPSWGCVKISKVLKMQGTSVSSPTVQHILIKNKMGIRAERVQILEEKVLHGKIKLTAEQLAVIEKENPCFKERNNGSSYPGEILIQDRIPVVNFNKIGRIYLEAVVDGYSNYAFGILTVSKKPESAVSILEDRVVPFYKKRGIMIKAVITDNALEFQAGKNHPYKRVLAANQIEHRITADNSLSHGFMERFVQISFAEFFRPKLKQKADWTLGALQADLDRWLIYYNTERPHDGYPNLGKKPADIVDQHYSKLKNKQSSWHQMEFYSI